MFGQVGLMIILLWGLASRIVTYMEHFALNALDLRDPPLML
jgi:hypothetical protein